MQRIVMYAVFLVLAQSAGAVENTSNRPLCPDTHYPCGEDSCCSR
ncbi:hypothetical protein [Sulfitobacter sp. SK012]|nr:hypothetical protein [Sulfitobacter sp. SK012]